MGLFENQEICLIFVEIKTNKPDCKENRYKYYGKYKFKQRTS
jgi:hypothetical protein